MILTKDKSITDLIKYYMGMISICLMALAFPGDANAKVDQGICDLKVLSLLIAKQTEALITIQHETDEVLNKQAMPLLSKSQLLYSLLDAAKDNISRSENLFERLLWLESISN